MTMEAFEVGEPVGRKPMSDLEVATAALFSWQCRLQEARTAKRAAERREEEALDHVSRCRRTVQELTELAKPDGAK